MLLLFLDIFLLLLFDHGSEFISSFPNSKLEDFDDKEADLLLLEEDEEEDVERSWKR